MIRLTDISKSYGNLKVLDHISVRIDEGDFIVIRGESGCGKTTLLSLVGQLMKPDEGKILWNGENLSFWSEEEKNRWRRKHLGFVFQQARLIDYLNARENVSVPLLYSGWPKDKAESRAEQLLDFMGLQGWQSHYPHELSGGQAQRVAIARALANKPDYLLCDEPTGSLDASSAEKVMELLKIFQKYGKTILMVTHDVSFEHAGSRLWRMDRGILKEV